MSHTIKKPEFNHRTEGEITTGVPGIDDFVSLEKIEALLMVFREPSLSFVKPYHLATILDTVFDEILDIKTRRGFQQAQKSRMTTN